MARYCDGTDDHVAFDVPNLATGTIHFLLALNTAPGADRRCIGYAESPGAATTDKQLRIYPDRTSVWYVFDGGEKYTTPAASAMTLGTWYGQGGTFNGTTSRHYFDGVEAGTVAAGNTYTAYTTPEFVGGRGDLGYVNLSVCEVGIWNAVLDAGEMLSLGKGFSPLMVRPASLVAYAPMMGKASPEVSVKGTSVTAVGAAEAAHPRVLYPARGPVR